MGTASDNGDMGPLVSAVQYGRVTALIEKGLQEARLVTGGLTPPAGVPAGGYFVSPTVFADVTNDMAIAREEVVCFRHAAPRRAAPRPPHRHTSMLALPFTPTLSLSLHPLLLVPLMCH